MFQGLFDLRYFHEPGVAVPSGWQIVTDDNPMPLLSSRQPKPPVSDVEMRSPGAWDGSEDSGSESSPRQEQEHAQTRMASESSEEESDFLKVKVGFSDCQRVTPMRFLHTC